jgi:hypothetical protein
MRTRSAAKKALVVSAALCLAWSNSFSQSPEDADTALSPDERPSLLVLLPDALMLVHRPRLSAAQRLALSLGLRSRPRDTVEPLPAPWRTSQPDRGFAQNLESALDPTQANWPWRALRVFTSSDLLERQLAALAGEDAAIVRLAVELDGAGTRVQLVARAELAMRHAIGTARETRSQVLLQHLAAPVPAQADRAQRSVAPFRPGGTLDQSVAAAALDLSRMLAVTVARTDEPGIAAPPSARRFKDAVPKPQCAECRPEDVILHEEPGRIWIAPASTPATILSLPLN